MQTFRIVEPGNYVRTVFIEALKQAGITVNAPVVGINPTPASGTSMPITSLISLPYSEYAKLILKVSYNIGADTSLVLFGLTQNVKNMADALLVEKNLLTSQYHLPAKEFYFQGSRYLVKDFGTSKSPKSTRQRAKYFGRDCPASGTLR